MGNSCTMGQSEGQQTLLVDPRPRRRRRRELPTQIRLKWAEEPLGRPPLPRWTPLVLTGEPPTLRLNWVEGEDPPVLRKKKPWTTTRR